MLAVIYHLFCSVQSAKRMRMSRVDLLVAICYKCIHLLIKISSDTDWKLVSRNHSSMQSCFLFFSCWTWKTVCSLSSRTHCFFRKFIVCSCSTFFLLRNSKVRSHSSTFWFDKLSTEQRTSVDWKGSLILSGPHVQYDNVFIEWQQDFLCA